MLDTDLFERQTTFSKNLVKTFRPKTFGHPRFEFDKFKPLMTEGFQIQTEDDRRFSVETSLPSFLRTSFDVQISQCPTFLIVISKILISIKSLFIPGYNSENRGI